MNGSTVSVRLPISIRYYTWAVISAWTATVAGLLVWTIVQRQHHTETEATTAALAYFDKDQAFRLWATSHGGVYVPATERTPPSPYLAHLPYRDIAAPSGEKLTLMSPAYVVRQMNTEFSDLYGVAGHITSLNPLRPENAPDDWERDALTAFESGVDEVSEQANIDGQPYLRLMRPMVTKRECLECHGHQGHQVGDVRGGVSVSVPLASLLEAERSEVVTFSVSLGVVWLFGLVAITVVAGQVGSRIRERQQADQRTRRLITELEVKNAELDSFAYTVSHDLKSPLITLKGYLGVLREDIANQDDAAVVEDLSCMVGAADKMEQLLKDLLELSRIGRVANPSEDVPLAELAREAVELVGGRIAEGGVQVDIGRDLPHVFGDRRRLLEVMQNLVDNAVKYMGDQPQPRIEIGAGIVESETICYVRDNGAGIEPRFHEKIFGLFDQLDQSAEGSGIGLALAKRIIEVHGGRIWVESEGKAKGAAFCFTLPAKTKSNLPPPPGCRPS